MEYPMLDPLREKNDLWQSEREARVSEQERGRKRGEETHRYNHLPTPAFAR